ncbi:MAG: oxidoreductase [Pararhodobacter sp.]|nr:oxidoreductase [Pararhodobacter sp.]
MPQPEGPTLLSITGQIDNTNADGAAQFDLTMIESLPQRETVTTTPWFEGAQRFSGPLLSDLMAASGASGSELRIIAINDYAATMPWADIESVPVILAVRHNGETMSVRDKGPLFVIYPFDEHPELHDEVYFSRSVWQVTAIEVLP